MTKGKFMRSKAQFMGHPIHPMLVSFPIAFIATYLEKQSNGEVRLRASGEAEGETA